MGTKGPISVVSSFSDDILLDKAGHYLDIKPGGPALFITKVLKDEHIVFKLFSTDKLITEIKLMGDDEFGKLKFSPKPIKAEKIKLNSWTIVSTINSEWDISRIRKVDYLFLDVQGFVREGRHFGKKKNWPQVTELTDRIYGIKGTAEEISCLPKQFVRHQKKKLLVTTYGVDGAEVFWRGIKYKIKAEPIKGLTDTIGAGDTFFTHFVLGLYHNFHPKEAAEEASRKTAIFLRQKNDQRN